MKHSESLKEIAPALTKAQADFKPINRDKTVTVRSDKGSYTGFPF
jgi:hypothetical protein